MFVSRFRVHVDPHERVYVYQSGRQVSVLEPGRHRRKRSCTYHAVPRGEQLIQLAAQEIPAQEGAVLKVTAVIRAKVNDPELFLSNESPTEFVYLATQIALREEFAALAISEAPKAPRQLPDLTQRITAAAAKAGADVGIGVVAVVIKDVILPSELRSAAIELLTVKSRGQTKLEEARAETAALRSLANAAKILEDHPLLAKLRLVEALPMGSTLQLAVDSTDQPPQHR